jgi:2-polyprenyl-3-methyl-5-hydroxy-6-metoxy-1,4-benzoquinol methylase
VTQQLTWLDRLLQSWRIWMAARFIPQQAVVADIGSWDGTLFTTLKNKQLSGFAIDPLIETNKQVLGINYIQGFFPQEVTLDADSVDVVALLAVMEHIPLHEQPAFALACYQCLKPNGKVIMTIPSPMVDKILQVLKKWKLVKGMETGQHYGLKPEQTFEIFKKAGFKPVFKGAFQAGLNNLFVLSKS